MATKEAMDNYFRWEEGELLCLAKVKGGDELPYALIVGSLAYINGHDRIKP